MARMNLDQATASDMTNAVKDVTIDPLKVDSPTDQKETSWPNEKWDEQWGTFNDPESAEIKSIFLTKAVWNVGKGYTADASTTVTLDHIRGWGKESFLDILFNMEVVKRVGGDAFAEIIRDKKSNKLINLKSLNPGGMAPVTNKKGILIRYDYTNGSGKTIKFKPANIFHLCHNRLADQMHGISDLDALKSTILADKESFVDVKKMMHHQVKPFILWKLKTDDDATINTLVTKIDAARNLGEDMFIPDDDDAIEYEIVQVNLSSMVLEWKREITSKLYRSVGVPQTNFGASGGTTESGGKMESLAHDQIWEKDQKQLEDQIWNQLFLKIDLIPPASIKPELQADEAKDANQGLEIQPSDTTAGVGR